MTCLPLMMLVPLLPGQSLTAHDIMCRVAENQTRAEAARAAYVFDMNVFVRMKRANGKLAREESRDYVVTPTDTGARRKLLKVEGKILDGKKETAYSTAGYRTKDSDIDGALTDSFAREVMWRKGGLGVDIAWFPLSAKRQSKFDFKLGGEEKYRDYDVWKISFIERDDDECWKGEALIEKHEFQPVLITTAWDCKVPGAVKVLLGTNISQVGARISYKRFDENVWFPVSCGGEVKFRALFLYARTVAFSARTSDFRRADVKSSIVFDTDDEP